jgi:hypothetical protein
MCLQPRLQRHGQTDVSGQPVVATDFFVINSLA